MEYTLHTGAYLPDGTQPMYPIHQGNIVLNNHTHHSQRAQMMNLMGSPLVAVNSHQVAAPVYQYITPTIPTRGIPQLRLRHDHGNLSISGDYDHDDTRHGIENPARATGSVAAQYETGRRGLRMSYWPSGAGKTVLDKQGTYNSWLNMIFLVK